MAAERVFRYNRGKSRNGCSVSIPKSSREHLERAVSELEREGIYSSILVAVDDSRASMEALHHAIGLAAYQRARLTLLTVVPEHPPIGETLAVAAGGLPPDDPTSAGDRLLRRLAEEVPGDQPITLLLRTGSAADQIVAVAEEGGYDLIVMGSRTHGVLSSVSRRVLRRSPVPVLVLHAERGRESAVESPTPPRPGAVGTGLVTPWG
jgi:nucleotide-binding universal stress UspA family protein